MLGIIDVGGGLRGAYTAGIYDFLNDRGVQPFDYLIGVSAGSANMVSYLARQRGRNHRSYTEYAFREEYMSLKNALKTGSYIGLDYIYTTLSGPGGEDPVDLPVFNADPARYEVVVTDAATGEAIYFDKSFVAQGNYDVIKASCAVPGAAKPYPVPGGRMGFDGGIADPVPYKRALEQGCDRLVVLLTRPADFVRPSLEHEDVMEKVLRKWPGTFAALKRRAVRYNRDVEAVKELEKAGKALLAAPADIAGMSTLKRDKEAIERLYQMGYADGEKVLAFAERA